MKLGIEEQKCQLYYSGITDDILISGKGFIRIGKIRNEDTLNELDFRTVKKGTRAKVVSRSKLTEIRKMALLFKWKGSINVGKPCRRWMRRMKRLGPGAECNTIVLL